jgi:hypothetical protein
MAVVGIRQEVIAEVGISQVGDRVAFVGVVGADMPVDTAQTHDR